MPMWLAGVGLQRWTRGWTSDKAGKYVPGLLCWAAVAAMCGLWPRYFAWANSPHRPQLHAALMGSGHTSGAFASYYFGAATILAVLGVALLDKPMGRLLVPLEKPIRWFANHTFSLYLFHFPVLVLLAILTRFDPSSMAQVVGVFFATVAICMVLSLVSEEKKLWWRKAVGRWLGALLGMMQGRESGSLAAPAMERPSGS
jgi:peptidoglycan/LPS O-acetylase OafA/YrhL